MICLIIFVCWVPLCLPAVIETTLVWTGLSPLTSLLIQLSPAAVSSIVSSSSTAAGAASLVSSIAVLV